MSDTSDVNIEKLVVKQIFFSSDECLSLLVEQTNLYASQEIGNMGKYKD